MQFKRIQYKISNYKSANLDFEDPKYFYIYSTSSTGTISAYK